MKAKYADHHKMAVLEEYQRIKSAKRVSDSLGIAPTTVRHWIRQFRLSNNLVPPSIKHENLQQLAMQKERIARETTNDPNVTILGCPPPGRSALDQKRAKESEIQNETSETNPYSIRRYYRQPR